MKNIRLKIIKIKDSSLLFCFARFIVSGGNFRFFTHFLRGDFRLKSSFVFGIAFSIGNVGMVFVSY